MKFKKLTGTHAHEARVPFSHVSPHLKPSFTPFTHNRAENTHSANLSISLSPSHSASQSRDLPFNLAVIPHRLINSPSQSRDLPRSPSPSRSRSRSRAVAHGLGLPLTRYVSLLSLHVQLVGIFVCKFYDFYAYFDCGF